MLKTIKIMGLLFSLKLLGSSSLEDSKSFRDAITVDSMRTHQKALFDIAKQNSGNRMAGSAGFSASVAYVKNQLEAAGFSVQLQEFPFAISTDKNDPELRIISPKGQSLTAYEDFVSFTTKGEAKADGEIEAVDLKIPSLKPNHSTSACEKEDFLHFKPGNIALIQRGGCTFKEKIENAIAAQASGVILFNEGNEGRTELIHSRIDSSKPGFPIIGMSFHAAETLRKNKLEGPTGVKAFLKVDVIETIRSVQNIITEIEGKNNNRVMAVGAHLDGVRAGAGINDNGSGSSCILELALKYKATLPMPENKLRFMWFAAEEFGLLGSDFYVNSLTRAENQKIMAMLNFDMIGSSNYARFVYDGDNSSKVKAMAEAGPSGSAYIETIFLNYFAGQNMVTHPTAFDGRSDYGPFIEAGIPAGGLFSGAEGYKSKKMAEIYGGISLAPFDPCYHRSCDDFAHTGGDQSSALALKSLDELSDAAAHALFYLSKTKETIRKDGVKAKKLDFEYRGNFLQR